MTERARAFLRGVGSLLDLSPDPRHLQALLPRGTTEERLARHWQRVGQHLRSAMHEMDHEVTIAKQKAEPKSAAPR